MSALRSVLRGVRDLPRRDWAVAWGIFGFFTTLRIVRTVYAHELWQWLPLFLVLHAMLGFQYLLARRSDIRQKEIRRLQTANAILLSEIGRLQAKRRDSKDAPKV